MNGITTILDHKKWVFAYIVLGLSFWRLDSGDVMAVIILIIPAVLSASSFDKSKWKKDDI